MVNGLSYRLMGRDGDVDDLVQESFASVFASLHRLEDPQSFAKFLASIVVRTATKTIRRRRIMRRLGLAGREAEGIDLDALVSSEVPADDAIELRRLYAAFERMPADLRVPLTLRRVEGLPLEEVARLCDCSLATVKRRISQAEAELRKERGS
jgi:RNA polymerase sigma-70 factor (ECF subfamily)